jgi:hypothetical protein
MDVQTAKLAKKLRDAELAAALVAAGFRNPASIRGAKDSELEAISGVGKVTKDKIRDKLPKRK